MKPLKWPIYIIAAIVCSIILSVSVSANGAPVKIFLNYLPELSNYGPTTASGVAMVSIGEAWVEIEAEGMEQLDGAQYEAWLATADNAQMISVGTFNGNADGQVKYNAEFDDIPVLEYRFLMISVEPIPDPNPAEADARRSIAGVFPNTRLELVSGTPTATLGPGITPTVGAPSGLPVTGNVNFNLLAMILLVGAGLVLVALGLISLALNRK